MKSIVLDNKLDLELFHAYIVDNPKETMILEFTEEDFPEIIDNIKIIYIRTSVDGKDKIYWTISGTKLLFDVEYLIFNSMVNIDEGDYFYPILKNLINEMKLFLKVTEKKPDLITTNPVIQSYNEIYKETKKFFNYILEKNND